jgi:hypothetical protein
MSRARGRLRVRVIVGAAVIAASLTVGSAGSTQAAPTNDAFADAQVITGIAGQVTAANTGAGAPEVGEPDHGKRGTFSLGAGASVWYQWTAPTSELVTFDVTCGAVPCFLIPIVDVYTGSAVDALTVVPDATYTSFTKQFNAVAGTTYHIAVAGRTGSQGTFLLRWSGRPANDDFATPQVITGTSGTLSASNVGATSEPGEPVPAIGQLSASVWFSWTPATTGTSNFAIGGSDAGVNLAVYEGNSLGALTLVTEAPKIDGSTPMPRVSFFGTVGTTYRILVRGITLGGRGTINLAWSLGAPANDIGSSWTSFNDPIHAQIVREMVGYPGLSTVGSNVGATKEIGEADHAGDPGGHSVWYSFQAHFDGASITFDTVGSGFDTVLAVYEDGVLLTADDDSAGGGASRVTFTARTMNPTTPNPSLTEYLIAVDGKAGATGPIRLNWYLTVPPNDDFADAQPIAGISGLVTDAQNLGASIEAGEPDHGFVNFPHTGRFTSRSLWYEWTAPTDGSFTFSAARSNGLGVTFVPVIDVYTGPSVDALTEVSPQTRPAFATIQFTAVAGTTYYIAVAGTDPFGSGLIDLQWSNVFPFPERATSTSVVCDSAATVGIATQCTATVTDIDSSPSSDGWRSDPMGAATITFVGLNQPTWGCTLIPDGNPATFSSSCTVTQFPDAVPDPPSGTAQAAYLETGSLFHAASTDPDGFGPITVSARASDTQVVCSPASVAATNSVTCTATVIEGLFTGGPVAGLQSHPAGTVTFSTNGPGAFDSNSCVLVPQPQFSRPRSSCSVTYTPAAAGTQRIDASYATDRVHASSADPDGFTLQVAPKPQRATATHIACTPTRFIFGGTASCTATVDDVQAGTASPPAGTVDLTSEVGGTFATCTLVPVDADSSACSATYAPTQYGFGSHILGSSYPGSLDHAPSSGPQSGFVVLLRTSATSIACEPLMIGQPSTCTVSVTDTTGPPDSGFAPHETVNVIAEGPGTLSAPSCFLSNVALGSPLSQCTVTYTPTAAGDGIHTITADYPGTPFGVYLGSSGSVALPVVNDTGTTELIALGPAQVWLGLKNSDDVGTKFDLLAEVLRNGTVVGSGQLNDVPSGSSGFNNARLQAIDLALSSTPDLLPGDTLQLRLSVRIAASSGHVSGTARLWFNDVAGNSHFSATIGSSTNNYYLLNGFVLGGSVGPGPKKTVDVTVNRKLGGNPFKPFGTWTVTF